jgi:hypothetical protein
MRLYGELAPEPASRAAAALAAVVRAQFDERWWSGTTRRYAAGFTAEGPVDVFALEPSWFPAVKAMIVSNERAAAHLDFVADGMRTAPPHNIEAFTYLPEASLAYGRDAEALHWIRYLLASQADYPEVPFTVVSHLAVGLTGLSPGPDGALTSRSHLPDDAWLQVGGVRIGTAEVAIRHEGRSASELTVLAGDAPVRWTAHFPDSTQQAEVPVGATVRFGR